MNYSFDVEHAKKYGCKEAIMIYHFQFWILKNKAENGDDMYLDMIKKLSEEDPEKIDNYPHDTPYLKTEEVIE